MLSIAKFLVQLILFIVMLFTMFMALCGVGAIFDEYANLLGILVIVFICLSSVFLFCGIDNAYQKAIRG